MCPCPTSLYRSNRPRHPPHYNQMRHLVTELRANAYSWPFHEAVNADEVTDYYDVITEPMGKCYICAQKA